MPLVDDLKPTLGSLLAPRGIVSLTGSDEEINPPAPPKDEVTDSPSFTDDLNSIASLFHPGYFGGAVPNAAFRTQNTIGSAIAKWQDTRGVNNDLRDPSYSPWKDVVGTPYEKYWKNTFAYSNNPAYTEALKRSIDRQNADRRTVSAGGAGGVVAGILAGTVDPTLLLPGGGGVTLARKGIWTFGKGALSGALVGGLGMTAYEGALQSTQDVRPASESAFNIGTGVVLGAVLGGALSGAFSRQQRVASEKGLEAIQNMFVPPEIAGLSANTTYKPTIEDLTIDGAAARNIAAATAFSPNTRGNFYESPLARQTMQELTDVAPYQQMHAEGKTLGQDVANSIRVSLAETFDRALMDHVKIFQNAKKQLGMSFDDFNNAVGAAMRNNDIGVNDAVSEAARMWRDSTTEPLLKQAIDLGMLPEDVHITEAPSYFTRDWNREKLIAQTPDVLDRFTAHFKQQLDEGYQAAVEELGNRRAELNMDKEEIKPEGKGKKAKFTEEQQAKLDAIEQKWQDLLRKFYDRWEIKRGAEIDPNNPGKAPDFTSHARDLAREVHQRLTGLDYGSNLVDPEYSRPIAFGPLKGRTFHIPDAKVQDLLNNDVTAVMRKFSRRMASQIELTRKFGDIGLKDRIEQIQREYQTLMEHTTSEADAKKLAADQRNAIRDIVALRDMHLGTYLAKENGSVPGRVSRAIKNINFILRMGGPALPHISNIYAPGLMHGPLRYMQDGIGNIVHGLDHIKALNKEARWAVGLEKITHHQLLTLTGIGDSYARGTRFERLLDSLTRVGSKWNGLSLMIDAQKNMSSWINQARLNEALLKGGDKKWLAYSGMTEAQQSTAAKFLKEYGTEEDGHLIANTDQWIEEGGQAGWEAARAYRVAISKNVNNDIISRAPGDLPLVSQTPLGSLFFQFRTFQLIAHQRMALRVLQLPKAQAISGIMGLTGVGMMAAAVKAWRSGQEGWDRFKDSARNPGYLVAEGLDNAAFFTLPTELGNDVERITGSAGYPVNPTKLPLSLTGQLINPDAPITANTQQGELSNDWVSVLGPTAGTTSDIIHGIGGTAVAEAHGTEPTKKEIHAAQRLIPFSSYLGMREMLQYLSGESTYNNQ